jgi:carboxyl-terminal processing protease
VLALLRPRSVCAVLLSSGFLFFAPHVSAIPEKDIRTLVQQAERFEKEANWEKAREIYEALLSQRDYGFRIRERYHHSLRHCWQSRRHQDFSYRKEVLSIEYGQALRLYNIVSNTLLDGAVDKKKLDPSKLFRNGLQEFDRALGNPHFVREHVPADKRHEVEAFRALLRKTWSQVGPLTRKEAAREISEVAMAAQVHLQLNMTVVIMEFACGSCYAIDEFTVYLTPNQLRELTRSLSQSEAIGVGLKLDISDSRIVIRDIMMGTPAAMTNPPLNPNDQIVSVDKMAVVDLPLKKVTDMLEGPVGSFVEIEVLSPGELNSRTVRLQRGASIININYFMLPNSAIGYLKISSFTESTVQEVDVAILNLSQQGMKGLILDLRENNGGVFESSIETARRFLSTGIITSTLHQDSKFNFVYQAKNPTALAIPMVVLVDGDTASAAEVLAGALKDNERAILIGQTTFGKGCTQCVLRLPNSLGGVPTGGLKLTVARFFSPKGVPYSGKGIVPHVILDDAMVRSQSAMDSYMNRAVAELNRMMSVPK